MTRGDGEAEMRGQCGFRTAKREIRPKSEVRRTIADFQKKQKKEILLWERLSRPELVEG
jgi:hypothetical protein